MEQIYEVVQIHHVPRTLNASCNIARWSGEVPARSHKPNDASLSLALATRVHSSTVEHLTVNQGVIGSNPVDPANLFINFKIIKDMINVNIAIETSQKVNRDNWLKAAGEKLSGAILAVANTGKRELRVSFKDLIIGAENLYESGEMLIYLNKTLDEAGYDHIVEPDGTLIISW